MPAYREFNQPPDNSASPGPKILATLAGMPGSNGLTLPTKDLIRRATATSLASARVIARSAELVRKSIENAQLVALPCQRATEVRGAIVCRNIQRPKPVRLRPADAGPVLPLTPTKLLELAEEFRGLANASTTPESRTAFEDLMLRYTALAAGYDSQRVGSQTLH